MESRTESKEVVHAPKFIPDEAVSTDSFGSHKLVADSIASVIRRERDLKVIGLLGSWGSGKSTVLKILQKDFGPLQETNTYFFVYDAWIHQSDPPRRSFLETLIGFLVSQKLTTKNEWQDELDKLNQRLEEHDTETTSIFTGAGKIIIFTILLFTIGLQLLKPEWLNYPFNFLGYKIDLPSLGVAFLISPLIAALLIYLWWRPTWNPRHRQFWKLQNWREHRRPYHRSTIFGLFVNKAIDKIKNRVIRTTDPTAIEFQDTYNRLMAAVSAPNRRFVFVVDNLDRIAESEAVTLWSTIRSFFLNRSDESVSDHPNFPLPIVILPLDTGAVRRMYGKGHDDPTADELAQSFLDKTFDLTFRVAPPVVSDWHDYFEKKLHEAFDNLITESDVYTATKLYEAFFAKRTEKEKQPQRGVTPRMIIKLVNTLVALKLQWGSQIPFAAMVYYAIHQNRIEKDIRSILETDDIDISRFDKDWRTAVAALHYGVPIDKALQVLIQPELRVSINEADGGAFSKLVPVPGFEGILEQTIETATSSPAVEPEFLTNAAALIKKASLKPIPSTNAAQRMLREAMAKPSKWKKISPSAALGVSALIESSPDSDAKGLTTQIAKSLSEVEAEFLNLDPAFVSANNGPQNWITAASALSTSAVARGIPLESITVFVPGDSNFFLAVLAQADHGRGALTALRSTQTPDSIIQQFGATAASLKFDATIEKIMMTLFETGTKWPWSLFISAAGAFIRQQSVEDGATTNAFRTLAFLRKQPNPNSAGELGQLSSDGQIFDKLHQAHSRNLHKAEAAIISTLILTNPSFNMGAVVGNSESGRNLTNDLSSMLADRRQIVPEIDKYLEEFGSLKELVDATQTNKALSALIQEIFVSRVKDSRIGSLPIADVMARLPIYLGLLDEGSRSSFVKKLPTYDGFWSELTKIPFEANAFTIFGILISDNEDLGKKARAELVQRIDQLDSKKWLEFLESGKEPLGLILGLIEKADQQLDFGDTLAEVLQGLMDKALMGGVADGALIKKWYELSRALGSYRRKTFLKNFRDRILGHSSPGGALVVLQNTDPTLLKEGEFDTEFDKAIRHVVMPLLGLSPDGVNWLANNANEIEVWIRKVDKGSRDHVSEKLADLIESSEQSDKVPIHKLVEVWRLKAAVDKLLPKKKEQDTKPQDETSDKKG